MLKSAVILAAGLILGCTKFDMALVDSGANSEAAAIGSGNDVVAADISDGGPDSSADRSETGLLQGECTAPQARPCYVGPADTEGVGVCKSGTQSCDPSGHWTASCPQQVTPSAETCNGADDDCDGKVDDIPRTLLTGQTVAFTALQTKDPGCSDSESSWVACNHAIHLYCLDQGCRTSGYGPVELGAGNVAVTCVTTEPLLNVSSDDLAPFGACPSNATLDAPARFECGRAVNGFCIAQGFATGFGPVARTQAGQWTITCLRPGHATVVTTNYATLTMFQGLCADQSAVRAIPRACAAATKRYCIANGYVSGFGPVSDPDGTSPNVVCLND
jgi:hypothetical protein